MHRRRALYAAAALPRLERGRHDLQDLLRARLADRADLAGRHALGGADELPVPAVRAHAPRRHRPERQPRSHFLVGRSPQVRPPQAAHRLQHPPVPLLPGQRRVRGDDSKRRAVLFFPTTTAAAAGRRRTSAAREALVVRRAAKAGRAAVSGRRPRAGHRRPRHLLDVLARAAPTPVLLRPQPARPDDLRLAQHEFGGTQQVPGPRRQQPDPARESVRPQRPLRPRHELRLLLPQSKQLRQAARALPAHRLPAEPQAQLRQPLRRPGLLQHRQPPAHRSPPLRRHLPRPTHHGRQLLRRRHARLLRQHHRRGWRRPPTKSRLHPRRRLS
mmetsp:Transcript_16233/g.49119  ORF Transcript_16233/g.49119 Transcript_16233/m.49119 type:complete len:329 (+) Transcript_16233:724-1710(+)